MTGIAISALPSISTVLGTDIFPVVQGGITYKETISQLQSFFNANIQLASAAQVTGLPATLAGLLPLSGGTMTGALNMGMHNITNLADPVNPQDAATKAFVQTFASGFTVILSAAAATTANLNATPAGAGIGATLTNAGALAAFAVDGYSANLNDRILVKNQTLSQHNGVYTVTTVGSGAVAWVLTRATDYDTAAQIIPGTLIAVNNGTVNGTTSWLETATVVTVDTDPISFSQFTFAPSSFFLIANNLSEGVPATMRTNLGLTGAATMSLPVSAANGGTGVANTNTITLGGNINTTGALTTAGAFTTVGAFAATLTFTGATNITLPTSGTLLTSAQPTINQPNIVGTTTNDNAAAGSVGEVISASVLAGAAVSITNATPKNITFVTLSAGDWDVWGDVYMNGAGTTQFTLIYGSISTVSGGGGVAGAINSSITNIAVPPGATGWTIGGSAVPAIPVSPCRISVAGSTPVYLTVNAFFSVSTASAFGRIIARRRR